MNGCRGRLTSWLVKMLTTAGIALRAASLNEVTGARRRLLARRLLDRHRRRLRAVQASRSGRSVETTNSTARQTVAVWQKMSQSLRMG